MSEIDELFRGYCAHVPDPPPGQATRVAQRAVSAAAGRTRTWHRLRRVPRVVAATAAALGAAAILGVLVFLFVQAPDSGQGPSTAPDWGLEVGVRVVPEATDRSLGDLTAMAARVVEARAMSLGIAGVQATEVGPGGLTLTVPAAKADYQIADLLVQANPRVYDLSRDVLATADDPEGLLPALRDAGAKPGARPAYALAMIPRRPGDETNYPSTFGPAASTRQELLQRTQLPERAQIVDVPEGVAIVWVDDYLTSNAAASSGARYWLVRDTPVFTAGDLVTASAIGDRIVPELTGPARQRLADAITAAPGRGADGAVPNLILSLGRGYGTYGAIGLLQADASSPGTPGFRTYDAGSARYVAALLAGGGLEARLSFESTRRFGVEPPLRGDVPNALPRQVTASGIAGLARRDILRILEARHATGTWTLYAARTPQGSDQFWAVPPSTPGEEGFPNGLCDMAPGAPVISSCGVTGTQFEPVSTIGTFTGRVRDDVAQVEARYQSGAVETASVRNGWFLLILPKGPGPREVVALAADGRVLGRLGNPFEPRAYHPEG